MAETDRRAARHYELHEIHEGALRLDLGLRAECDGYEEAVEAAFAYLEEHDPERERKVGGLEIVRVDARGRRTVWRYDARSGSVRERDLVSHWGFPVTRRWTGPPESPPR